MLNPNFLAVGLLISRNGANFECTQVRIPQIEFQHIENGSKFECSISDFLLNIAEKKIEIIQGKSSPDYIELPAPNQKLDVEIFALSNKQQQKLDHKSEFVAGILKRKISRGQRKLLEEASAEITHEINDRARRAENPAEMVEHPPSAATLNRWVASYEKCGKSIAALIPKTALAGGKKRLSEKNEELIEQAFKETLFDHGISNISAIHESYETLAERHNLQCITSDSEPEPIVDRATISRRFYAIPKIDRDIAIHGYQTGRAMNRVSKGHLPSEFALEYVEVDHGQLDLYVIDDLLFIPLGIPWITIYRDRHTGVVLGFYISFRQTSLQSIFGGLRHSIYPHDRIATIWPDIASPWPSGFGVNYVSDRGADFLSPRYRLALREMGSDVLYCERQTPWHKAQVERFIGTTNHHLVETMPGKVYPFRKAPREYNAKKQAVIRFSALVYLIHKWVAEIYHHTPHSRNLASPLERWDKSIIDMPIPLPPDPDRLLVMTGEMHEKSIGFDGITFEWMTYTSPELEEVCKDIGRAKQKLQFIVNPDNVAHASVIDPRTKMSFRVFNTDPGYAAGLSLLQHRFIRRETKVKLSKSNSSRELALTRASVQETLAEEILQKQSADKANLHRLAIRAGINSNAVLDGECRSVADILTLAKEVSAKNAKTDTPSASSTASESSPFSNDVPHFRWA